MDSDLKVTVQGVRDFDDDYEIIFRVEQGSLSIYLRWTFANLKQSETIVEKGVGNDRDYAGNYMTVSDNMVMISMQGVMHQTLRLPLAACQSAFQEMVTLYKVREEHNSNKVVVPRADDNWRAKKINK
jgi:hypothetical protein